MNKESSPQPELLDRDTLTHAVTELNLTPGEYAVFGSGPMVARHLRQTTDIDILVTQEQYRKLKVDRGWEEKTFRPGETYLTHSIFEAIPSLDYPGYQPNVESLIAEAEPIDGVPFVRLEEILKWKKALGRPKDQDDIATLKNYLSGTF